jgi:hypothetical protein
MDLRELQQQLQQAVLGNPSGIAAAIEDAPPLPVAERLAIYRHAYGARLTEALGDTYPALRAVLGDEDFETLCAAFIAGHPSVHRSIRWYGAELAQFLEQEPPFAGQPILAELARLEWTLSAVFDAADATPVPRAALAAVEPAAWNDLRFEFHPSVRRLPLCWNTVAVWRAMTNGEAAPAPQRAERAVPWLVWRQELQNYFRSLTADEAAALDAALRGARFGEICGLLGEWLDAGEIPGRAAGFLAAWADGGLLTGLSVGARA